MRTSGAPDDPHVAAARVVYDATADQYAARIGTEIRPAVEGAVDRAFLSAFAELVPDGPVADVGCGPGRVAAFLAERGLSVVGVDVSTAMLAVARGAHPTIHFEEGSLTSLPFRDGSLAGAACWYSIIHTPPEHLGDVCAELGRVLTHDGQLLVAFQAGDGTRVDRAGVYGTDLALTSYRHDADEVARHLTAAGLAVHARGVRQPELDHESTPQAFLLASPAAVR